MHSIYKRLLTTTFPGGETRSRVRTEIPIQPSGSWSNPSLGVQALPFPGDPPVGESVVTQAVEDPGDSENGSGRTGVQACGIRVHLP